MMYLWIIPLIIVLWAIWWYTKKEKQINSEKMKLILITFILLGLGIAGIAIKLWAKKDGKFAGTCASQNPMLNKNGEPCGFCGRTPDQFKDCDEPQHS